MSLHGQKHSLQLEVQGEENVTLLLDKFIFYCELSVLMVFLFAVTQQVYCLAAESASELETWMTKLREAGVSDVMAENPVLSTAAAAADQASEEVKAADLGTMGEEPPPAK